MTAQHVEEGDDFHSYDKLSLDAEGTQLSTTSHIRKGEH